GKLQDWSGRSAAGAFRAGAARAATEMSTGPGGAERELERRMLLSFERPSAQPGRAPLRGP
ncbi:MAG TPA: hypothetical protein VM656_11675, partial [Pyrinomonadaceae bacterium]|nr:hypothetical protein [Pyrinomonadaceae bacterium]